MKGLLIFLIMTFTLALPVGGWTKTVLQHKVVYEKRHDHVFLMYESDVNNNVVPQNFEHPGKLTAEEVSKILEQLRYSKSFLFDWRGNHKVFYESELENLSKQISRALQDASPNEWVEFASTVKSRDPGESAPLLTDGYVFKKDGKLHVVLLNLKSEITRKNRPRGGDPRECFSLEFNRMNLTEGISTPPVIPGARFLDKPHNNWAVIDIASLLGQKKAPMVKARASTKVESKNLVERMKILKELFERDLITEEEYKKKKEEILDEL